MALSAAAAIPIIIVCIILISIHYAKEAKMTSNLRWMMRRSGNSPRQGPTQPQPQPESPPSYSSSNREPPPAYIREPVLYPPVALNQIDPAHYQPTTPGS
ncbi:hypothetical protein M378DRAFT_162860 [Amanita muscaria Koide BX008]|uniref:Uncharacterized protein n=1 Tax=Amanita muscaria (strain Koide BX008) TaxID=946122 RepID=A0A0C2X7J9_AMAMK|nr:hypothetical protein M378DRAFT_162860 [Amanita muscaria Koide BX008]